MRKISASIISGFIVFCFMLYGFVNAVDKVNLPILSLSPSEEYIQEMIRKQLQSTEELPTMYDEDGTIENVEKDDLTMIATEKSPMLARYLNYQISHSENFINNGYFEGNLSQSDIHLIPGITDDLSRYQRTISYEQYKGYTILCEMLQSINMKLYGKQWHDLTIDEKVTVVTTMNLWDDNTRRKIIKIAAEELLPGLSVEN